MKYIISGKNIELTNALKEYAEEKIGKVGKMLSGEVEAVITMSMERNMQKVEIQLNASTESFRGELEDLDMYAAIDKLVDVLQGQIRKSKDRKDKMIKNETIREKELISKVERNIEKGNIVKYETYSLKPIGIEDAKIILESTKDIFYTFVNIDTNKVNVIFRTKDGNFGVIEPNV